MRVDGARTCVQQPTGKHLSAAHTGPGEEQTPHLCSRPEAPPVQQLERFAGRRCKPWALPCLEGPEAVLALLCPAARRRAAAVDQPGTAQVASQLVVEPSSTLRSACSFGGRHGLHRSGG